MEFSIGFVNKAVTWMFFLHSGKNGHCNRCPTFYQPSSPGGKRTSSSVVPAGCPQGLSVGRQSVLLTGSWGYSELLLSQEQGLGVTSACAHGFLFSCRCTLPFYSASFVPVGHRTYADAVNPVSGSPATWEPVMWSEPPGPEPPSEQGFRASRTLRATFSHSWPPPRSPQISHQMSFRS